MCYTFSMNNVPKNLQSVLWSVKTDNLDLENDKYYTRPRFYFVKDAILDLKNWLPDERNYVKNTPRNIRS